MLVVSQSAWAVTEIPFWHAMEDELGKEVESPWPPVSTRHTRIIVSCRFSKGAYPQELAAGIAAWRTGNAQAILQVYEVGTVTMIASDADINNDESAFVPAVLGYYSDSKAGHLTLVVIEDA